MIKKLAKQPSINESICIFLLNLVALLQQKPIPIVYDFWLMERFNHYMSYSKNISISEIKQVNTKWNFRGSVLTLQH
jgi:hypothetical protein